MWYLLIVIVTGSFISSDAKFYNLEFKNKDACLKAQTAAKSESKGSIGYLCISSETGEVIK